MSAQAPANHSESGPGGWRGLLASRRARLFAVMAVATGAIAILAIQAAGSSLSYYSTPEEIAAHESAETVMAGSRWRVGGRVVGESVQEENGRPVAFDIVGDHGERLHITYDGIVPNLFGPQAFVVVEGEVTGPGTLRASSVIIKHENEFVTDPADASIVE